MSHSQAKLRPLVTLLLGVTLGCGGDDKPVIDLGFDGGKDDVDASTHDLDAATKDAAPPEAGGALSDGGAPDASADASLSDAGVPGDGGPSAPAFSCTSFTPATTGMCGGAHCEQTPQELRAATPTSATCGTAYEVTSLCSLEAPGAVLSCAYAALLGGPDTKTCAAAKLPKMRSACLDCYVASTDCARDHCLTACFDPQAIACEECRLREGCMAAFYTCSGVPSPYPGLN